MISFESFKRVELDTLIRKLQVLLPSNWWSLLFDEFGLRSGQESIERKVNENRKIVKRNLKCLMKL